MNSELFRYIARICARLGSEWGFDPSDRYIAFPEADREVQRAWASDADLQYTFKSRRFSAIQLSLAGDSRIIISGVPFGLAPASPVRTASPGELLVFSQKVALRPQVPVQRLFDVASIPIDEEYCGHDAEVVSSCFETVFSTERPQEVLCFCTAVMNAVLSEDSLYEVNEDTKLREAYLRRDFVSCALEARLLSSLASANLASQFLEVYKVIEARYFRVYLRKLYDELRLGIDEEEFYRKIEDHIGWRPREIDALEKLIRNVSTDGDIQMILDGLGIQEQDREKSYERIASKIYAYRNKLVHWRHVVNQEADLEELSAMTRMAILMATLVEKHFSRQPWACQCPDTIHPI